jgi:ATP-dependent exoDNAse (exonuclease V) alpha subunit
LTEVFRQAAESRIIVNAHRINHGLMPDLALAESGDFYFVDAADAEEGVRKLLAIVRDRIPNRFTLDPIRDIQVLCPMNRAASELMRVAQFGTGSKDGGMSGPRRSANGATARLHCRGIRPPEDG